MGKENLIYRPGRASGERIIETPAAQLLKEMNFSFGYAAFHCGINEPDIDTLAKEYNTPVEVYTYAEFLNGRLIFSQREITGTNTRVALTDENLNIVSREQFPTNPSNPYETLGKIADIIHSCDYDIVGAGMSGPGPLDLINGQILTPPNLI